MNINFIDVGQVRILIWVSDRLTSCDLLGVEEGRCIDPKIMKVYSWKPKTFGPGWTSSVVKNSRFYIL